MKLSENKKQDIALLVLRLAAGVIFVLHGYGKLFGGNPGMEGFTKMVTGLGFPLPVVFAYAAALSEFLGGIALILGIFPRAATFFLGCVMLVALIAVKKGQLPKADPDLALLAIVVAIALHGAGRYSLGMFLRKKAAAPGSTPAPTQPMP
ncbi:MAG TPA: DoxX family protein [Candidatus Eisenbacteria bacterium]|nr:DoxX family protein [Candidatus Eisenbacteria bacterium]